MSSVAVAAVALSSLSTFGAVAATADTTTTTTPPPTTTTTLGPPIQGVTPLNVAFQVDTVQGSSSTSIKPPVGCAQTNQFYVGQQVVFRMAAVNVAAGGIALTGANATAQVIVPGVATPITMGYGNHGTVAFWTGAWKTGGYPTMGVVAFKIVVTSIAVPAVTKKVSYIKRVAVKVNGKSVWRNGRVLTRAVRVTKTVVVTPAVPGQTATFTQTGWSSSSVLTINPLPVA
ncbi:MAG TPA: hypothetical protein VMV96_02110 [Acidimicrobiales bacterium]|nr:hypothetical protein [Acidimicrobiales bacterium]